jgi:hypothetical protein
MTLRENSEWLRYVLWACAIGLCFLAASFISAPVHDFGKIIGSVMGVFLFGFSGFVFKHTKQQLTPRGGR